MFDFTLSFAGLVRGDMGACSYIIKDKNHEIIHKNSVLMDFRHELHGLYLGLPVVEWEALLLGLDKLQELDGSVRIKGSGLVLNQLAGVWHCRKWYLKDSRDRARELLKDYLWEFIPKDVPECVDLCEEVYLLNKGRGLPPSFTQT